MSEDICDRLVRFNQHKECVSTDLEVEAAAEITRLHEENARLREDLASAKQAAAAYEAWKFPEDIQALTLENERLLEENARMQGLLREAHVKMEANNLWSNLRHRVAAAIREGEEDE